MAQGKSTREYVKVRDLIEKIDKSLQDMAAELQELVQTVAGWEDCPPVGDYYGEDYDFYNGEDLRILELSQTIRVRALLKQAVAVELGVLRRKPKRLPEDRAVRRILVRAVAQILQSALGKSLNAMTCATLDEYEIEILEDWSSRHNVKNWWDAYKHPKLKNSVEKMFSGLREQQTSDGTHPT